MGIHRWRGELVGDRDEAGRICGWTGATYQDYVRRYGAPGPIDWREPGTGKSLYRLDKVAEYRANRPGSGARNDLPGGRTDQRKKIQKPTAVRRPREAPDWTGGAEDMAVEVVRGQPDRDTDDAFRAMVTEQVSSYLAEYPPRVPLPSPVTEKVAADVAAAVADDYSGAGSALVSRERLLIYLGAAYERGTDRTA